MMDVDFFDFIDDVYDYDEQEVVDGTPPEWPPRLAGGRDLCGCVPCQADEPVFHRVAHDFDMLEV